MNKNLKKSLVFFVIILPIGGFFILFQHLVTTRLAKTAQATISNPIEEAPIKNVPIEKAPIEKPETDPTPALIAPEEKKGAAPTTKKVDPPAPIACAYPAQVLNLTNWKETLPTGSSGSPTEIKQATLASYSVNPYFRPNSTCDGVTFRAPVNGVTTSGSGYPRSELREMSNDGKTLASWSTNSGTHSMFIDEAITAVPKTKKHVVAGQIHDANDDVVVIRLEYPKLFIDINGKTGPTLDANYTLGKRFTVKFTAEKGQIKIYYNSSATPSYTMKKSGSGYYFKAGAYTQSNCSKEKSCDSSNFGEVTIYKLEIQN